MIEPGNSAAWLVRFSASEAAFDRQAGTGEQAGAEHRDQRYDHNGDQNVEPRHRDGERCRSRPDIGVPLIEGDQHGDGQADPSDRAEERPEAGDDAGLAEGQQAPHARGGAHRAQSREVRATVGGGESGRDRGGPERMSAAMIVSTSRLSLRAGCPRSTKMGRPWPRAACARSCSSMEGTRVVVASRASGETSNPSARAVSAVIRMTGTAVGWGSANPGTDRGC